MNRHLQVFCAAFVVVSPVCTSAPSGQVSPFPYRLQPYMLTPTSSDTSSVEIGDVTGDGRADVVLITVASAFDGQDAVLLYAQDGLGHLLPPQVVPHGEGLSGTTGLALVDLDGANGMDVVVGNSGQLGLFLSTAGGQLSSPQVIAAPDGANYIEALDLNGDGRLDLAATSWANRGAIHLIGPDGMTSAPWSVAVSGYNTTASGDLDGDGDADLAIGSGQGLNFVFIYRNIGDGMPQSVRFLQPPCGSGSIQGVAIGDFDSDGMGDVAILSGGNLPNTCLAVFHGLGNYQFSPPTVLATHHSPGTSRAADMNGDGRDDLVVAHDAGRRVGIYLQDGDGVLGPEQLYKLPFSNSIHSEGLAVGDINSDGCLDVAIANDAGLLTLLGEGCDPLHFDGFED